MPDRPIKSAEAPCGAGITEYLSDFDRALSQHIAHCPKRKCKRARDRK